LVVEFGSEFARIEKRLVQLVRLAAGTFLEDARDAIADFDLYPATESPFPLARTP
jgi:hypothetical protein